MNTKTLMQLVFLCFLACSCKKELEPQDSDGISTAAVAENTAAGVVPTQPNAQTATPTVSTSQPTQTAAGKNPPHGQPNHRCDIAVGAPLNSPPAKTGVTTTQAVSQPAMKFNPAQVVAQQNAAVKTAPGMNPPHGQPNHRCDISVGTPLSSPVGKSTAAPTMVKTEKSTTEQIPALLNAPSTVTPTAPGMNPPHGQEGHKCEIAVGAPLPKS